MAENGFSIPSPFSVPGGASFLKVCRYEEGNPLRARAVGRAQEYPWGGLWVREHGTAEQKGMV